ncbi:unnamed protein product [Alternaria alternata]
MSTANADQEASTAAVTRSCFKKFQQCFQQTDGKTKAHVQTRLADLRLWADSVGAVAHGKASLDYRFKHRSDDTLFIRSLLSMLEELLKDLEESLLIAKDETNLQDIMTNIDSTIDTLAFIGVQIRRSGRKSRIRKADDSFHVNQDNYRDLRAHLACVVSARPTKEGRPKDEGKNIHSIEHFTKMELRPIQERLIVANLRRRHRFKEAQRRSDQSKDYIAEVAPPVIPQQFIAISKTGFEKQDVSPLQDKEIAAVMELQSPLSGPTREDTQTIAPTSASGVDSKWGGLQEQRRPKPPATRLTSTTARMRYPRAPLLSNAEQILAKCPGCCQGIPTTELEDSRWRKHVANDLCPYTCVVTNCPTPYNLFVTREEWNDHVINDHPPCWQCPCCIDNPPIFESISGITHHLMTKHPDEAEANLENCLSDAEINIIGITNCPLCDSEGPQDSLDLMEHVLQHVHDFSLRSLPWPADLPITLDKSAGLFDMGAVSKVIKGEYRESDRHDVADWAEQALVPTFDQSREILICYDDEGKERILGDHATFEAAEGQASLQLRDVDRNKNDQESAQKDPRQQDYFSQLGNDYFVDGSSDGRFSQTYRLSQQSEGTERSTNNHGLKRWICPICHAQSEPELSGEKTFFEHFILSHPEEQPEDNFPGEKDRWMQFMLNEAYWLGIEADSTRVVEGGEKEMEGVEYGKQVMETDGNHARELNRTSSLPLSTSSTPASAKSLRRHLIWALQPSMFEKTKNQKFLPRDIFEDILPGSTINRGGNREDPADTVLRIMEIEPNIASSDNRALANHILKNSRIVFLILLWIKHDQLYEAMKLFMDHRFTDGSLPLSAWSGDQLKNNSENHLFSRMEIVQSSQSAAEDPIWDVSYINDFEDAQWMFLAPKFSTKERDGHFDERCPIPFVDNSPIKEHGARSIVHKYTIHHAHYEESLNPAPNEPFVVAVKAFRKGGENVAADVRKEVDALEMMNALEKDHIVRFLTSFRRGTLDDLEHFVLFEWAHGGNLDDLWKELAELPRTAKLMKWLVEQLCGLAKALTAAHGANCRHGDLKPANILWFRDATRPYGTLKIGDWGEAKIHKEVTSSRYMETTARYGTRRYEPPETGLHSSRQGQGLLKRSRLYDLWGFGCIIFECIIWYLYDMARLNKFNYSNVGTYGTSDFFWEHNHVTGIAKVHGVVEHWMEHMSKDALCRSGETALGDLLQIVRTGLLVVELPKDGGSASQADGAPLQNSKAGSAEFADIRMSSDAHDSHQTIEVTEPESSKLEDADATSNVHGITPSFDIAESSFTEPIGLQDPQTKHNVRLRAHELEKSLSQILQAQRGDRYWEWFQDPKPEPVNTDSFSRLLASSGLPESTESTETNLRAPPNPKIDYEHPSLDPEDWQLELDNIFAAQLLSRLATISGTSTLQSLPPASLCAECKEFGERLPETNFSMSYTTQVLKHNADAKLCDLCCLLWQAHHRYTSTEGKETDATTTMPTRLIYVGKDGDNIVHLQEMEGKNVVSWIALSYRWGDSSPFSITRQNLHNHIEGMELSALPQTFQDAIKVTRALGHKYLWIDSLCIIQGEDGDFNEESNRMENVYGGAYCVLAASCAADQRSGFLLPRVARTSVALNHEGRAGDGGTIYVCSFIEDFRSHVLQGALNKRGWFLQQHALARRTVFFTEHQMYWECGHGVRCETMIKMTK